MREFLLALRAAMHPLGQKQLLSITAGGDALPLRAAVQGQQESVRGAVLGGPVLMCALAALGARGG